MIIWDCIVVRNQRVSCFRVVQKSKLYIKVLFGTVLWLFETILTCMIIQDCIVLRNQKVSCRGVLQRRNRIMKIYYIFLVTSGFLPPLPLYDYLGLYCNHFEEIKPCLIIWDCIVFKEPKNIMHSCSAMQILRNSAKYTPWEWIE